MSTTKTKTIHVRVEPGVKRNAESVLKKIGMKPSDAVSMFYRQVIMHEGLPFEPRIPSAAMKRSLSEDVSKRPRYKSAKEMSTQILGNTTFN